MTNGLPRNWEMWSLADVGEWVGGGTPSSSNPAYWDGDIPWVSPKDMKVEVIASTQDRITAKAIENSAAKLIPADSVLFVTRSGILAHSFPVASTKVAVTVNQDLKAITPVEAIDSEYLAWVLRFLEQKILHSCSKHGTTVHSIEIPALKALPIPIPPKSEQRRIVAKIEELFSELDNGTEALTTARQQLTVYRQAVLKHAFDGQLTENWRKRNQSTLASSSELRARLTKERRDYHERLLAAWYARLKRWQRAGSEGQRPTVVRPLKPITAMPREVLQHLPALPEGWVWEKLALMTCGVEYGTAAKSAKAGAVPVVRMGNLQGGRIVWSDLAYTDDPDEIAQYNLKPGDVLFNRTNSPELVGKTAIYLGERPALFAGYLIRISHNPAVVDGHYLNWFLTSRVARQYGNAVKTDGVNQSNINGEKLQGYPFPFCSLAEQREIVRLLDEKLSRCDRLLSEIEDHLLRTNALRQSILANAFSGQFVAQDPEDEPASILLTRRRAEAERDGSKTKNGRTGRNGKKEAA